MGDKITNNYNPLWVAVAPEAFQDALQPLVEQRRQQGMEAQVVTPGQLAPNTGKPLPDAAAVRSALAAHLHGLYRGLGGTRPMYVLIVGDDDVPALGDPLEVPRGIYPEQTSPTARPAIESEIFYGDADNDLLLDFPVGRLPVSSVEELQAYVRKLLRHEAQPVRPGQIALYGGKAGFGWMVDLLLEAFAYVETQQIPATLPLRAHYDLPDSILHSDTTFGGLLQSGEAAIINYIGHGARHYIASKPRFGTRDLATLQPAARAPLVNFMACSAGCFAGGDCLGEGLVVHEHGALAVFGSNEVIAPLVLRYFGAGMVPLLTPGNDPRLGDLFMAGQRAVRPHSDLLQRVVRNLPVSVQDGLYLRPQLDEALVRQRAQMMLLGDPAVRLGLGHRKADTLAVDDARRLFPQIPVPISARIRHAFVGSTDALEKSGTPIDIRQLPAADLAVLVQLFDYLLFRATEMLPAMRALLPAVGSVRVEAGMLQVPLPEALTIPVGALPAAVRSMLGGHGALQVATQLQFALRLSGSTIELADVSGLQVTRADGSTQRVTSIAMQFLPDLPMQLQIRVALPPLDAAAIAQLNTTFDQLVANISATARRYALQIAEDPATRTAQYVVQDRRENKPAARLMVADRHSTPVVLPHGVAVPLPKGLMARELVYRDGVAHLEFHEAPYGEREQAYLWFPKNYDPQDRQHAVSDFDAHLAELRQAVGYERSPELLPIVGAGNLPVYEFCALPSLRDTALTATWPLSGGEEAHGAHAEFDDLFAHEATDAPQADGHRASGSGSGFTFSLGDLSFESAKVCVVLDTSAELAQPMARTLQEVWPLVKKLQDAVPGMVRYFLSVGFVTTGASGVVMALPETSLTDGGIADISTWLGGLVFTGPGGDLVAGEQLCQGQMPGAKIAVLTTRAQVAHGGPLTERAIALDDPASFPTFGQPDVAAAVQRLVQAQNASMPQMVVPQAPADPAASRNAEEMYRAVLRDPRSVPLEELAACGWSADCRFAWYHVIRFAPRTAVDGGITSDRAIAALTNLLRHPPRNAHEASLRNILILSFKYLLWDLAKERREVSPAMYGAAQQLGFDLRTLRQQTMEQQRGFDPDAEVQP